MRRAWLLALTLALASLGCQASRQTVVAANESSEPVLVRLELIPGYWRLQPGDRLTLIRGDSAFPKIGGAFLILPETCEQIDASVLMDFGSVLLTIAGRPPSIDVSPLVGVAGEPTPVGEHGC